MLENEMMNESDVAREVARELAPEFDRPSVPGLQDLTDKVIKNELRPVRNVMHDVAAQIEIARTIVEISAVMLANWHALNAQDRDKMWTSVMAKMTAPVRIAKDVAQKIVDAVAAKMKQTD